VADLNSGKSHHAAWHDLIKDPTKLIPLLILMHMDGSHAGVSADLELNPVKIALDIFQLCNKAIFEKLNSLQMACLHKPTSFTLGLSFRQACFDPSQMH